MSSGDESILRSHRRQVAVFFADLRGWTSFVDAVEPEELMRVLGEFHAVIGRPRRALRGDGRIPRGRRRPALLQRSDRDPRRAAARRAAGVRAARGDGRADASAGASAGYDLDFGVGIALGYATCGEIGFEGRSDYAAIGAVTNLAARLADEATGGQILIAQRLLRGGRGRCRGRAGRRVHPQGVPAAGRRVQRRCRSREGVLAVSGRSILVRGSHDAIADPVLHESSRDTPRLSPRLIFEQRNKLLLESPPRKALEDERSLRLSHFERTSAGDIRCRPEYQQPRLRRVVDAHLVHVEVDRLGDDLFALARPPDGRENLPGRFRTIRFEAAAAVVCGGQTDVVQHRGRIEQLGVPRDALEHAEQHSPGVGAEAVVREGDIETSRQTRSASRHAFESGTLSRSRR